MKLHFTRAAFLAGLAFSAMLLLLSAPEVQAAPDTVYTKLTSQQLLQIMKGEGYTVEYDLNDDEDAPGPESDILWKIDGDKTYMFNYDTESLMFYAGFYDTDVTTKEVNEWNASQRFSRSYIDEDGDPGIELDLDLEGGVTEARIVDFLKTCRGAFRKWNKDIINN